MPTRAGRYLMYASHNRATVFGLNFFMIPWILAFLFTGYFPLRNTDGTLGAFWMLLSPFFKIGYIYIPDSDM